MKLIRNFSMMGEKNRIFFLVFYLSVPVIVAFVSIIVALVYAGTYQISYENITDNMIYHSP